LGSSPETEKTKLYVLEKCEGSWITRSAQPGETLFKIQVRAGTRFYTKELNQHETHEAVMALAAFTSKLRINWVGPTFVKELAK
jgi:hypothetical protein